VIALNSHGITNGSANASAWLEDDHAEIICLARPEFVGRIGGGVLLRARVREALLRHGLLQVGFFGVYVEGGRNRSLTAGGWSGVKN
jgi:hypothetical protein